MLAMRRLVLVLVGAAFVLPAGPASAKPAPPAPETVPAFGMGHIKTEWLAGWANAPQALDVNGLRDLDLMGQVNTKLYRARFRADQVWDGSGYNRWVMQDNLVLQAAKRDITILPIIIRMAGDSAYVPPKSDAERADLASFAAAAAARYGPNGTFWTAPDSQWASCSGCTPHPIRVWEFWNEENTAPYWDAPNPAEFGAALQAVRTSLRAADPSARVLFGGLADVLNDPVAHQIEPNDFLRQAIGVVGANGFDALGVHSYHPDPLVAVDRVKRIVDTLKTYAGSQGNAPRQQVWITEFGRPTFPDNATTEAAQANFLTTYVDRLLKQRKAWNLGPLAPYMFGDAAGASESWHFLGMRHTNSDGTDGGPKPAWNALVARTAGAAPLPLPAVR
jgi:hypothetical protein